MSKFQFNAEVELHAFRDALGDMFPKICNDAKAFVGRLESSNEGNNVVSKLSGLSVTAKCILKTKEGHSLQMPLNNAMSILIRFGIQLREIDTAMGTRIMKDSAVVSGGIQSELPAPCVDWLNQQRNAAKEKQVATK